MNLEYVQQALLSSEYTVCLVGKNMMKRTGLRYLRDSDEAYDLEQKYGYSLEELYSARMFGTRPHLFYQFYREVILEGIRDPGPAYDALSDLEQMGFLKSIITKDVFDLPGRAGCANVFALHGTVFHNSHCSRCGKEFSMDYIRGSTDIPMCDECHIPLHPGTSLLGEMVDNKVISQAAHEVSRAELLVLCGLNFGSKLTRDMIQYFQGKKLILINTEKHYQDERADLVYYGVLDMILPEVVNLLKEKR